MTTTSAEFDAWMAQQYDALFPHASDPAILDRAVDFLANMAGDGDVLELGIGTGRLALPLSERGVRVHGIELAPAMVDVLRAKPGADAIDVTIGDIATERLDRSFRLVYLVRNTITNLTTQDEQVACFRNVAAHLEPGGMFVVENYVPHLQRIPPGERIHVFDHTPEHLGFEEYVDLVGQIAISHHYWTIDGTLHSRSGAFRYVWPSELDLMAQLAGMTLRERWCDWERNPFTGASESHVSVWAKAV